MAISYDTLNKLQWCNTNPNKTLQDLNNSAFVGLYNGGWSTRPNLPPTIPLSDTINYVLDKKSTFAYKQIGELLKSQGVVLTDIDTVAVTALKSSVEKIADARSKLTILQATGTATDKTISQKIITDNLNKKLNIGQYGFGGISINQSSEIKDDQKSAIISWGNINPTIGGVTGLPKYSTGLISHIGTANASLIVVDTDTGEIYSTGKGSSTWKPVRKHYDNKNTTVDSKGFLRASGTATSVVTTDITSALGGSTTLVASQKLVNDTNTNLTNKINGAINGSFKSKGALGTIDLDTLNAAGHCGVYFQSANANATPERHYPVKLAGTLFVTEAAGFTQTYIVYKGANDIYTRNNYGGTWSAWVKKLSVKDLTSALGTSTTLVANQKLVNDVNTKADNAQTKADQAHTLASNAIPNSKKTSALGSSTDLVATQKLVNDVSVRTTNAQTKADQAHTLATTANNTANTAKNTADQALAKANDGSGLGYGQKWVDVKKQRVSGTTYTNNTGKPITVFLEGFNTNFYVNEVLITNISDKSTITFIVPNGQTYKYYGRSGHEASIWVELR